jgi:hypothetical protein
METLKKIFAIIFSILFIGTAVIALVLFNLDRKAFTAETYQKAFARDDFYNKLPDVIAEAVTSGNSQNQLPIMVKGMSRDTWAAFFRTLLPPETLKVMGDDFLNSTFAYLNMKRNSVELSLTPLKLSMASDAGVQAVFTLLKSQPDCTLLQIGQMTIGLLARNEVQFCNPPQTIVPLLTPVIHGQMQLTAQVIPETFTLLSAPPANDPRLRLQKSRMAMRLSPVVPLVFLLLMTVLAVDSFKSLLNWWGIPFIITGGLAAAMSLIGAPIFGRVFQHILVKRMPVYLPSVLLGYASDLAAAMLRAFLNPMFWQGIILASIGVVMVIISIFIVLKEKK